MARIAGVDIPREKRLVISLTYIYGIGRTTASEICAGTGIDESTRVRDLTDAEVTKLRGYIEEHVEVEGDLRREVNQNIKRKMEIGCYQGLRHRRGLPLLHLVHLLVCALASLPCHPPSPHPVRRESLQGSGDLASPRDSRPPSSRGRGTRPRLLPS